MSQSKKNNILVGDIGNTETKIFFRNNKIEKKIALKSNEMIYDQNIYNITSNKWTRNYSYPKLLVPKTANGLDSSNGSEPVCVVVCSSSPNSINSPVD